MLKQNVLEWMTFLGSIGSFQSVKFEKYIMVVPETTSRIGNNFYKILHFKFQKLFLGLILKEFSKLLVKKKKIFQSRVFTLDFIINN